MKTVDLSPLTAAPDAREWSIIQDYADPAIADGLAVETDNGEYND